jgi:hypothetical protein
MYHSQVTNSAGVLCLFVYLTYLFYLRLYRSRDSAVGIATGYDLNDQGFGVPSPSECSGPASRYYLCIFLQGLTKTTKYLCQGSRSPGQDSEMCTFQIWVGDITIWVGLLDEDVRGLSVFEERVWKSQSIFHWYTYILDSYFVIDSLWLPCWHSDLLLSNHAFTRWAMIGRFCIEWTSNPAPSLCYRQL